MKKLIKYDGTKVFMSPAGTLYTPQKILEDFPAVGYFAHVIETDANEEVCFAVMNLSAMRSMNNIDQSLSEADSIKALEDIMNAPVVQEVSPEERIAAALEFQNLMSMDDVTSTTT